MPSGPPGGSGRPSAFMTAAQLVRAQEDEQRRKAEYRAAMEEYSPQRKKVKLERTPLDNIPINAQGSSLGTASAPESSISSGDAGPSFDSESTTLIPTPAIPPDTLQKIQEDVPQLSPEQSAVLERVIRGENVFFTGAAGTGKSVLLRAIVAEFAKREAQEMEKQWLQWRDEQKQKGVALAQALDEGPPKVSTERNRRSYRHHAGEKDTQEFVPDFGRLNRWKLGVTASTGMASANIGGCTVHSWAGIATGEAPVERLVEIIFNQSWVVERWRDTHAVIIDEIGMIDGMLLDKLEEIGRIVRGSEEPFGGLQLIISGDFLQLPPVGPVDPDGRRLEPTMAFDAKSWRRVIPDINRFELSKVYRQADSTFVRLLNRLRRGLVDDEDVDRLVACNRPLNFNDGIEATQLFNTNAKVRNHNDARLAELPGQLHTFEARDHAGTDSQGRQLSEGQATDLLDRRLTWPQELNLRVGAQVMLLANMKDDGLVNGSTGLVVDFITDAERRSRNITLVSLCCHITQPPSIKFPVVRFTRIRGSKPPPDRVVVGLAWTCVLNAQQQEQASRTQVPLNLAWAWTVHKSQGQTLERVKIDLSYTFAEGQAYTAISRAVSLEGLQLEHFTRGAVIVNEKVLEWYDQLARDKVKAEKVGPKLERV